MEDVGLQLHQQLVGRHPAVHLQLRQPRAAVLVHGLHDLRDTQTHELQHGHMILEILDYLLSFVGVVGLWRLVVYLISIFCSLKATTGNSLICSRLGY